MSDNCPICTRGTEFYERGSAWITIACPRCGHFKITHEAAIEAPNRHKNKPEKIALLSHSVRKASGRDGRAHIYTDTLDNFLKGELPTVTEQANNVLSYFCESSYEPGVKTGIQAEDCVAISGAVTSFGVHAIFDYLRECNFLTVPKHSKEHVVTLKGWQHYEQIKKQSKDSTIAFMAMKFGDEELDQMVDNTFRQAVKETGFRLQKLTDDQAAGLIDDQLRVQIRRSRFLIADLTHGNKGAYWEAGFAEGLGLPVIYTCEESKFNEQSHFDTNHHLTVMWNSEKPEEAAKKLKATIRATLPEAAKMEDTQ